MLNLAPSLLISRVLTLIIALTIHEFAHAFVADRFGDDTPRANGRLSLNPLKHLDVFGSLMLILVGFGWAKPVPVNPYALKRRSDSALMWVSLAGPASNLLLAIAAGVILRLRLVPWTASTTFLPSAADFLFTFLTINLVLLLFNLIPLSPLDGEKIVAFFLPRQLAQGFANIQRFGPIILMVLLFVLPYLGIDIISWVMSPALSGLQKFILGVS
jgi:Zn-dependent protease